MASSSKKQVLVVIVVVTVTAVLAAPAPALAADILVGDIQSGEVQDWLLDVGGRRYVWRPSFDYVNWVDGRDFIVGDTLVFKYVTGHYSVVRAASAASFAACSQADSLGVWTSGDDRVVPNATGDWWFFCGVDDYCQQGMKFTVRVLPYVHISIPPSSQPSGGGDATGLASAQRGGVVSVLAAVAGVAAVAALFYSRRRFRPAVVVHQSYRRPCPAVNDNSKNVPWFNL